MLLFVFWRQSRGVLAEGKPTLLASAVWHEEGDLFVHTCFY